MMIRITHVLLFLLCRTGSLFGQVELEFIQPTITTNENELILAFAGGINSAQFQTIDVDGDNDLDLILFDRSSDKINCFENTGETYTYRPEFEYLFPDGIQHWLVLADYDCDGKKDLFTYTGQGIRVFRNTSSGAGLTWDLVVDPLKTLGSSSQINLLFNPTDIPSIFDLDSDGDLDILVFDFASSNQIEFHQNHTIENTGTCGLEFVRETRTYGEIRDCDCDDFTVDEPCSTSGRILHAGGKAILSLDYNMDGLLDIVLSQEACNNLSFAENIGATANASFDPFDNNFPNFSTPINFSSFPAAFYEDVTFDGKKDLLISSNERSNDDQNIDFKSSSLLYENMGQFNTNLFSSATPFLQDKMIDVGEFAYPAIADVDGDGNNDLIIGNAGNPTGSEYVSSMSYFKSTATGMVWQTDDLFGLSTLGLTFIKPQFIDINNDQLVDLVFSARDAVNSTGIHYLFNQGNAQMLFDLSQLKTMNVALTSLDDFHLTDINEDGLPDLLMGLSSGRLEYHTNTGIIGDPTFTLENSEFLGIMDSGDRSNISITTGDINGDDVPDLITTDRSGQLVIYSNFPSASVAKQESFIRTGEGSALVPTRFGRVSKPAAGQLFGQSTLAIGSIQGGVRLLANSGESVENGLTLQAFPVPSSEDHIVNFLTNQSNTRLEIYTLTGRKILETFLSAYNISSLNLSHLESGLYLAKATNGRQSCTSKIVLSE